MPTRRSPRRVPLGVRNRLPPVSEEEDDESEGGVIAAAKKKKIGTRPTKNVDTLDIAPPPPPPVVEAPTAEEIAAADKALARMEAELRIKADPIAIQNATIIEADEGTSSEEEDDEDEAKSNWQVNSRRSSSRRSSVQHLSARERRAIRRLTAIIRDGGESRRAQERRDSMAAMARAQNIEFERRRQSERKRRMRSIAKLIDLSLVWDWLEKIGAAATDGEYESDSDDSDTQDHRNHTHMLYTCLRHDGPDDTAAAATDSFESENSAEARAISDRLDAEAVTIIESIATTSMVEAFATELGLVFHGKAANRARPKVLRGLRDLAAISDLSPRVRDYDLKSGFYLIDSFLAKDICLTARRSFRDLKRLVKGLIDRGIPSGLIPRLPRPRYVSGARKALNNAFSKSQTLGNRKWEASKVSLIQNWLNTLVSIVHNYKPPGNQQTVSMPASSRTFHHAATGHSSDNTINNFYAGFCCLSPGAEHLEDFLLKFAIVFHR